MLAIHWSPVKNTKRILKDGIRKGKNGVYCFPLTGNHYVDRLWVDIFNARQKREFNGFIFRLTESDMPAYFGDWLFAKSSDKFEKEIQSLKVLGQEFNENLLSHIGFLLCEQASEESIRMSYAEFGKMKLKDANRTLAKELEDVGALDYSMSNMQLVISGSVKPKRILKVIGQSDKTGRIKRIEKLEKIVDSEMKKNMP